MAIPITVGTKMPAILSTSFCTGALLPCASCTILMMWASMVSLPTFTALNRKLPFWLIVPANTFSFSFFNTGTGSPLNMLSSTYELPDMTMPSTAIFSPGFTSITSPALTSSIAVCFSVPSACTTMTVFGCKPISFLMAEEVLPLALSSSSFPKRMNAIITAAASKYT